MKYKVLIRLYVPEIEEKYEMYIPVNEYVGKLANNLSDFVHKISKVYPAKKNARMYDRWTGLVFNEQAIIRDCNILNGSEIVLI